MARRRSGKLSEEDRALWKRVAENVTPIRPNSAPIDDVVKTAPPVVRPKSPQKRDEGLPPKAQHLFRIGSAAPPSTRGHDLVPPLAQRLAAMPPQVDAKTHTKLKRGKLRPDARIDLHGMTLSQAHPVLNRFMMGAYSRQQRLVLVITGKGKDRDDGGPVPVPRGILRHQVPHWLQTPPLNSIVLQVTQAHLRHGGDGAYYVYLRRMK
ncbi:DNA mismatch repair protein MutS [Pseudoruegeria sp. SK021]|nr:Smr/MutS family protein [Pseudoruegeria sp. SK021]OSP55406.1 DNA mismatch repair protein MutS [Pseudoruegeria sp. SK021]